MKQAIAWIYLIGVIAFTIYFNFFGSVAERYRGFFYNLWVSLIWPILLVLGFLKLALGLVLIGVFVYYAYIRRP